MMDTPHFVETPQAGDMSMSFTCMVPEMPTVNWVSWNCGKHHCYTALLQTPHTSTFMDLTSLAREQSFTSTPIMVSICLCVWNCFRVIN